MLSIDTSAAEALPGVRAVCTFQNTTQKVWNGAAPMFITPLPHKPVLDQVIFTDEPKYIGDEVAAVAADTEEIAEQAVKLIKVEWQELPAVYETLEAIKPESPTSSRSLPIRSITTSAAAPSCWSSAGTPTPPLTGATRWWSTT